MGSHPWTWTLPHRALSYSRCTENTPYATAGRGTLSHLKLSPGKWSQKRPWPWNVFCDSLLCPQVVLRATLSPCVRGCLFPVIFWNQSKTKGYLDQIELMRIILIFLLQWHRKEAGSWWAQEDEKGIGPLFLCSSSSFLLVFKDLPLDLRHFLCYVLMFICNF